jgi:hypothetical protein
MAAFPTGSLANREQEDPLGLLPSVSPHIFDIFYPFPSSMVFLLHLIKDRRFNRKI